MDSVLRNQATAAKIQLLEDATQNPMTGNAWPVVTTSFFKVVAACRSTDDIKIFSTNITSNDSVKRDWLRKVDSGPQLLVYDEYASGLQIVCTQPRRLAATELASRVADEMGVILGEEVGYKIRGDQMVNKNKKKTRLTYLTEGVLLRQLSSDKNLSAYACVIIDEAHERTVNLDLLLALLKKVVQRRKDFKVGVLMAPIYQSSEIANDYPDR
ncbi:LOW QUALITY PROTEIN: pre-mRNA splicing factor ATP-dependent RNA helicase PRP43 [Colletotrichum tofieldiae]|nr:LOW QUALITY PROTEIN: pre-mRNA splicing factor ATP-dependent RNA helicase PRP43 [Colletotrichum tofieldiae]